ncbi:hypothetical protein HYE82_08745 [Streptomyces sp. BR123]|uniref:hypothetical protein n=1 Tax=Streptomyces sp. BR123 TaxID=2749828 RepID=UPI0015C41B51|nr:hypothetical protein [Streptomyces sp. BR123]NXY94478.1 hypothetical protein [Streptomyces sp. BR123]
MTGWIGDFAAANPWPVAIGAVVVGLALLALLAVAAKAVLKAFKTRRYTQGRMTVAQIVATIGALGATGVGANTAWRFAGEHLHISNTWERAGLFLVGEVMLFGLALMARQNLHSKMRRTGLPGTLVWVLSAFLAVPAISESDSVAGAAWRIVLGPLGAALLWHLAMGIELRHSGEENAQNNGVAARILRRFQQQLLARLGIAEQDKDAEELIQERARSRAAELADEYRSLTEKQLKGRKGRRLRTKLRATLRRADVAGNPERKRLLLADLAVSSHAPALVELEHPSPWVESPEPVAAPAVETPELTSGEERMVALFRTYLAQNGTAAAALELEAGNPLPASKDGVDAELEQLLDEASKSDGPDDDDDPKGPGGAPEPAEQELFPVLDGTAREHALHVAALEPLNNADAIRYAIRETGSAVAGQLVRWLAEHGKQGVNEGQAYRVAKKHFEDQRRSNIRPLRPTSGD